MLKQIFILILLVSLWHPPVFADGETHATHFVALDGNDSKDCLDPDLPCNSIKYAIDQAAKSSHVHIATGTYEVAAEDVVHFLGDKVPLMGGYTTADGFAKRDDINNPVTLLGIPFEFRAQVEALGFKVVSDSAGLSSQRVQEVEKFTAAYQHAATVQKTQVTCQNGAADGYECANIDLVAQLPLPSFSSTPSSASDIWGHVDMNNGNEYALMGLNNGIAVVDVSDPANPVEVGTISGRSSTWRDVKVYQ
ncbi:MAG: choice-of-anchor B family protein, partial [Gammaproteobacteria bacterium]|nr:choice-of-anchor B family protein [Gammaproteobacteria bacterium]